MNHTVEILDKPFIVENQVISDQTVVVAFITPSGIVKKRLEYGMANREKILERYRKEGYVDLDYLYLKDFTLNDTRTRPYERLTINGLSAFRAFFDGDTDFSGTDFFEEKVSFFEATFYGSYGDFRDCRFLCGIFEFSKVELNLRNIYFDESRFMDCQMNFSGLLVRGGDFHFFNVRCVNSRLDFTGSRFSEGFKDFRKLLVKNGDMVFRSVHFGNGDTDFIEMDLDRGTIDFRMARFGLGDLNFGGSRLGSGDKDFSGVVFPEGMVSFTGVHFGTGSLHLIDARFRRGNIYFSQCRYDGGDIHITGTDFGDGFLEFCDSELTLETFNIVSCRFGKGDIDFSRIKLPQTALNFYGTEFNEGKLIFFDSIVQDLTFHECTFNNHVYLNLGDCKTLKILNSIIEKTMDLRNAEDSDQERIHMLDLSGTKNLGHIYVDWERDQVRDMIYRQGQATTLLDKAYQFRLLKENYRLIGQYKDEDDAYVEYKRCERQHHFSKLRIRERVSRWQEPVASLLTLKEKGAHFFSWLIFDKIGAFGTSPFSVFVAMVNVVSLFALIYALPAVNIAYESKFVSYENPILRELLRGFYYSIVTFLTIGYGDVNPDGLLGVVLSGTEGFGGVFLMSYFTVSVVRKLLR